MPRVQDFLEEFTNEMWQQLRKDEKRWGDTWIERPRLGQENRIFSRFTAYYDQFIYGKTPIPWEKVANLALIGWIRENHPEVLVDRETETIILDE
jgi:hypothetical protein